MPSTGRRAGVIYGVALGAGTLIGVRALLIPLYADAAGASHSTVGLLFTSYTLAAAVSGLLGGGFIARWGAQHVIPAALALAVVAQVATANTRAIPFLFLTQIAGGIAQGVSQTGLFVSAVVAATPGRTGTAVGRMTFFTQSGWLIGPAVGGIALHWLSMRADLMLMALPALVAAIVGFFGITRTSGVSAKFELKRPLMIILHRRAFPCVLLMMLGTTLGWGGFQAYFPLLAKRTLGYSATQVGILLALAAVANGGARTAGPVYDAARRKGLIVCIVLFGFAAGLVVMPDMRQFWEIALLLILAVGCLGLGFVGAATVFTYVAPEDARSQVMGLFTSLQFLGVAASPAIVAPAMDHSLTLGFELMGLLVAVFAASALVLRRRVVAAAQAVPAMVG